MRQQQHLLISLFALALLLLHPRAESVNCDGKDKSNHNLNKRQADVVSPVVITTWEFEAACGDAWSVLEGQGDAVDAVEAGCERCETDRCGGSVGWGSHPGENGEVTMDAMLMDGNTFNVGAVAVLRRIRHPVKVARKVLDNTRHSLLAGELATEFALKMGFVEESLSSNKSEIIWQRWKEQNHCQPNFWTNVLPDPTQECGPYTPITDGPRKSATEEDRGDFGQADNHDTIGMVALDWTGKMAAGTSTNGAVFKIPGRIGDSPIPGSGAYVDSSVGGAAATGDGDVMLRFLPSFIAVEAMRAGMPPQLAAQSAVQRIAAAYPTFSGAVIALAKDGRYGASCHGMPYFPYFVASEETQGATMVTVECSAPTKEWPLEKGPGDERVDGTNVP